MNVSVVSIDGERWYTALYEQHHAFGSLQANSVFAADEFQDTFDANLAARLHLT